MTDIRDFQVKAFKDLLGEISTAVEAGQNITIMGVTYAPVPARDEGDTLITKIVKAQDKEVLASKGLSTRDSRRMAGIAVEVVAQEILNLPIAQTTGSASYLIRQHLESVSRA